jgi:hypothetical protein
MNMSDVAFSSLRIMITQRRNLIDELREQHSDACRALADAFAEDVRAFEQARDEIARLRARVAELEAGRDDRAKYLDEVFADWNHDAQNPRTRG